MRAKRRFGCLVAGDANLDLLLEGPRALVQGTEQLAAGMHLVLGGSSSITACNLAALGVRTAFAGVVGSDSFGKMTADALKTAGVNIKGLQRRAGVQTGLTTWITSGGGRSGLTFPGSIALLRGTDISGEELASAQHLHVGAYFLLTGLHKGAADLFRRAKSVGCTTSMDCNYDPSEKWEGGLLKVLPFVDVFLPNENEACKVTRSTSVEAAALALAKLAGIVVIKRGAEGMLLCEGTTLSALPAKRTKAVDTTGAGDSFNAGFISRYITGATLMDCARFAAKVAAKSTTKVGGTAALMGSS